MNAGGIKPTLSSLLVDRQIISREQYAKASQRQAEQGISLDQALIDLGILSEDDLRAIYDDLLQVPFLKLEEVEIDREAVRHVPASVAHRYRLIPVRRSGNALAVAMSNPMDPDALTALRNVTDFEIIAFAGHYNAIEHAVFVHYGDPVMQPEAEPLPAASLAIRPRAALDGERPGHMGKSIQLNSGQTFDSYVIDGANQFPASVARTIADLSANEIYNPFHCWGPEGSGKSHLLQAVANRVMAQFPLKRSILTTGQRFAEELFQSARDKKLNFFRYLYRELDLLLIDDGDALLSREWAQRELLETFHALQKKGKHLALAATRNFAAEPRIIPELRQVLEGGVIAAFSSYSAKARAEIAKKRAGDIILPEAVLRELVERTDGLNDMLDLLQQVSVRVAIEEKAVTVATVEELLKLYGRSAAQAPAARPRILPESTTAEPAMKPLEA